MRKRHPDREFTPIKADAECMYMKMITVDKLLRTLREGVHEVRVPEAIANRARLAIERMVAIH
jgi:quinolinate synthase